MTRMDYCLLYEYKLGCSDFNNLIRATHLWQPDLILRHVYKKRFSFILSQSVRISLQSLQKMVLSANKTPKKIIWKKSNNISKHAEFYADFKTVEKIAKKFTHKK